MTRIGQIEQEYWHRVPISRKGILWERMQCWPGRYQPPGDIVECGVHRAVSLCQWIALREITQWKTRIWAYDTFGAFPLEEATDEEARLVAKLEHTAGKCLTVDEVTNIVHGLGVRDVFLIQCRLPDVDPLKIPDRIAFLHLDLDLYASTRDALQIFGPRLTHNAVVACDNWHSFPGERKAVEEYFGDSITWNGTRPVWGIVNA